MIKLFVVLFLVVKGVPSKEPVAAFAREGSFKTEKECEDFLKTASFKKSQKAVAEAVKKKGLAAKFACIEAQDKAKSEDNTI